MAKKKNKGLAAPPVNHALNLAAVLNEKTRDLVPVVEAFEMVADCGVSHRAPNAHHTGASEKRRVGGTARAADCLSVRWGGPVMSSKSKMGVR